MEAKASKHASKCEQTCVCACARERGALQRTGFSPSVPRVPERDVGQRTTRVFSGGAPCRARAALARIAAGATGVPNFRLHPPQRAVLCGQRHAPVFGCLLFTYCAHARRRRRFGFCLFGCVSLAISSQLDGTRERTGREPYARAPRRGGAAAKRARVMRA
jgi:hypothetical protein